MYEWSRNTAMDLINDADLCLDNVRMFSNHIRTNYRYECSLQLFMVQSHSDTRNIKLSTQFYTLHHWNHGSFVPLLAPIEVQKLHLLTKAKGQHFCELWLIKLLLGSFYHIMRILVGWISNLQAFTADTQDGANVISLGIQRGGNLKKRGKQTNRPSRGSALIKATEI